MNIYIEYSETRISSYRDDEQFGSWGEENDFSIVRATISKPDGYEYETFELNEKIKKYDEIYVLYMTYSTGDSFGNSSGNGEILWVFSDKEIAETALAEWREHEEAQYVEFYISDGQKVRMGNPAYGYFEHVDTLDIIPMIVK